MYLSTSLSRLFKFSCLIIFLSTYVANQAHAGSGANKKWAKSSRKQQTNTAPTIWGDPASNIEAGGFYSFKPVAGDADGDRLTFSIQNRPAWARFNRRSGRLAGSPSTSDTGTYANIRISVSDGTTVSALPAFNLAVSNTAGQTGSVYLSWVAPTSRSDGTALPLSELAGYTLYYGASLDNYTDSIDINDPYKTDVTVSELPAGTYYFVLTARNTAGQESYFSETISRQVN